MYLKNEKKPRNYKMMENKKRNETKRGIKLGENFFIRINIINNENVFSTSEKK